MRWGLHTRRISVAAAVGLAALALCGCPSEELGPAPEVPPGCGDGPWGDLPVDGDTVYVDGAADPGGDGSEDAPLTEIQGGLDLAGTRGGGLVAVAAGTYAEALTFGAEHSGVELAGRCRELVVLDGSEVGQAWLVEVDVGVEGTAGIAGVTIEGSGAWVASMPASEWPVEGGGVRVTAGQVSLADMAIQDGLGKGMLVHGSGSTVFIRSLLIRDQASLVIWEQGSPVVALKGGGIEIQNRAAVDAQGLVVEDVHGDGVQVGLGVHLTGQDVQIEHAGDSGLKVLREQGVANQPVISLTDLRIESCRLEGIFAMGPATIDLRDVEIVDNGWFGIRLWAGKLFLERGWIEGNHKFGIGAIGTNTELHVVDVDVVDTRLWWAPVGAKYNGALLLEHGATGVVESSRFENNAMFGAVLLGTPDGEVDDTVDAELIDVEITNTHRGIHFATGIGLFVAGGFRLDAHDVSVSGTEGPGMVVNGAAATCRACTLVDNTFAGAVVIDGSEVEVVDSTIEGTGPDESLGGGVGLWAANPWAELDVTVVVENTTIDAQSIGGVWLGAPGAYSFRNNVLHGGEQPEILPGYPSHGDAVYVAGGLGPWDESDPDHPTGVLLQDNEIRDAGGVGVFLDGASATLRDNTYTGNDVDVWQQHCDETVGPVIECEAPSIESCPDPARLNTELRWLFNFLDPETTE